MRRIALVVLSLVAAFGSAAPPKVTLVGASRASLYSGDAPPVAADGGVPLVGPTATIPAAAVKGANAYFVASDGSVVARSWKEIAADGRVDFGLPTHLARVNVAVTRAGAAVAQAVVELKDGDRSQRAVTGPDGGAGFAFVRVGEATLVARARGEGNRTESRSASVTIAAGEPPAFRVEFGAASSVASPPAAPRTGAGFGTNLVSIALGLLVAGGVGYGLWRYARERPAAAEALLKRIGADVPAPPEPEPDPVPAVPVAPEPPATILLPAEPAISLGSVGPASRLVGADGDEFAIPEGETVVGREVLGGLMLPHDSVSRRHARIVRAGERVTVEDLGSTNGTFLDGTRVNGQAPVSAGARLRFGAVEFRAEE